MTYDNFFKRVVRGFLTHCEVESDVSVGTLPLRIDLVITCRHPPSNAMTVPLIERNLAQINLIEYKSSHDLPKSHDLAKLFGYLGLYCDQKKLGLELIRNRFTLWYISARRPSFLDVLLRESILTSTNSPGLYQVRVPTMCPYFFLVIDELDVCEENIPLLLLSSGETLRATIRLLARRGRLDEKSLTKYLNFTIIINYKDVSDMTELQTRLPASLRENIKLAIQDIGLKEVIHLIGIEEVVRVVDLKELVRVVDLKELSGWLTSRSWSGWLTSRSWSGWLTSRSWSGWLTSRSWSGWLTSRSWSGWLTSRSWSGWLG
ncbi:MAG: hypothetical protein ACTSRS_16800 [Candidatus Helarchaeota archaeon]